MNYLDQIIKKWLNDAVQELPAESAVNISSAFQAVGGIATSDLIALYRKIGGMQTMDNNYFRLWSLAEIREENAVQSSHGILFADYLIDSWCYRARPISEDESEIYVDFFDGSSPALIGNNLNEFLLACLNDPELVLHHPRSINNDA